MLSVISYKSLVSGQRGVSLYIAFMIMTALLGIALGVSSLLFSQIGILKGIGHSVFAFYATEAGLENALYIANTTCFEDPDPVVCLQTNLPAGQVPLANEASYQLRAEAPGDPGCSDDPVLNYTYCVRAEGNYEQARRAVRVAR